MAQAPKTTTPRLLNVAANYISFEWDVVSDGYTYSIYRKQSDQDWIDQVVLKGPGDLYSSTKFYDSNLVPLTTYDYAITVIGPGLDESDPVYLSGIKTFETNSYSVQIAPNVQLYNSFVSSRFENNDMSISAGPNRLALVRPSYKFDSSHENIVDVDVAPHFMVANNNVQIWGRAPNTCGGFGCSVPAFLSGMTILFDRKQKVVRLSANKGKTWYAEKLLPDRAGDPYHENMYSHNEYGLFVLGWQTIMVINDKSNIHWSNSGIHWSDPSITMYGGEETIVSDLQFKHWVDYPGGTIAGSGQAIGSDSEWVYLAVSNEIHRCNISTLQWDSNVLVMPSTFRVKEFVTYNGIVYAFCPGLGGCSNWDADSIAGIYDISSTWQTSTRVYGEDPAELARIHPLFSNLSRDDNGMIFGVESQKWYDAGGEYTWIESNPPMASNARPYRDQLYITGGGVNPLVFTQRNERWQYEEQYIYNGYEVIGETFSWPRLRVNDTNHLSVITAIQSYSNQVILTDIYSEGAAQITIAPSTSTFIGFPGYVTGAILYNSDSGKLIAYNSLSTKTKNEAEFGWLLPDIVARGVLQQYAIPPKPIEDLAVIPSLTPFAERFLPDHYSYREPKFVEFLREYLKYISNGSMSNYGQLYTMLSAHDANEPSVFIDMFENDLMRRNIYVDSTTRDRLNTFLYNTARDFYSIKGTVDSYKFLFKLLYGEEVNVKVENSYDFVYEYDVVVGTKNNASTSSLSDTEALAMGQSMSGRQMFQSDHRGDLNAILSDIPANCEVVSVEYRGKVTIDSVQYPRYTIKTINVFGDFVVGCAYEMNNEDNVLLMTPYSEPDILLTAYDVNAYDKQFNFVLRLESELPYSRYYSDVINFVHPVGFDFIGCYLLSSFVTTEVPADHIETIIEYSDSVKWDNGIPSVYPDYIADLVPGVPYDEYQYSTKTYMMNDGSIKNLLKVKPCPNSGPINALAIDPNYYIDNPPESTPPYGLTVDQRRTKASPLFDGSTGRFFDRINNPDTNNAIYGSTVVSLARCRLDRTRLKDNLANPLDPLATQRKNVHL